MTGENRELIKNSKSEGHREKLHPTVHCGCALHHSSKNLEELETKMALVGW